MLAHLSFRINSSSMKETPTLRGCFGKLARAETLIRELRRRNLSFFKKGDFKSEIVRNPETGSQQLVATAIQAPPVSHSLIVGDILYNLRSCLDHLVHQLIVANTGAQPTYRTYEFPVFVTEAKFNKNVDRLLRDVSPDGVERVKQVQPFTFERPKDTSLYILNEMGLVDKHRLPLLAVIRARVSAMIAEDDSAEMMWFGGGYDGLVEAGSVLATFDARVPESMKLNAIVGFDIALADGPHDLPAVRLLEMMWRVVRQIVEHVGIAVDAGAATKFRDENLRIASHQQRRAERPIRRGRRTRRRGAKSR